MEQTILTDIQRQVLTEVANEPFLRDFYLSGGTALSAYYLMHRISDDLDFFSPTDIDITFLLGFIGQLGRTLHAIEIKQERLFDRNLFLLIFADGTELKLEFTKYPFPSLDLHLEKDNIRVDSLRDVSANKLMAMLERFDPKDFVDLYFLLQNGSIFDIRRDVEKKFGTKIGDVFLGTELAKVRRIEALPKMLKPLSIVELKDFFTMQAIQLKQNIIS